MPLSFFTQLETLSFGRSRHAASQVQSGPEKNAQSLMHRHSATVCSRITSGFHGHRNAPKKSLSTKECTNLYKFVKCFLINSRKWIHVNERLHVNQRGYKKHMNTNMTHDTSDS